MRPTRSLEGIRYNTKLEKLFTPRCFIAVVPPRPILSFLRFVGLVVVAFPYFAFAESPLIPEFQATQAGSDEIQEAAARIAADVEFLSSDDMRGRGPGTGGLERAAEYVAERWKILGLETKLFNDSPYQEFNVPGEVRSSKSERNKLRWIEASSVGNDSKATAKNRLELRLDDDFRPMSVGGNKSVDAPLVFVGYGITASKGQWSYDDYGSVDVRGKVVVVIRKEPRQADPNSPFDGTKSSRHALFGTKVANAKSHGAVGIVFVNDRQSSQVPERLPAIEDAGNGAPNETIPVFFASRAAVENLIDRVRPGFKLEQIEKDIDTDLQARSFDISGWRASGEIFLEKTSQRIKNVIACLPGHGALADETVVFGAHFDHVGMGGPGSLAPGTYEVHNGADDNASGTAALLEVARRFAISRSNDLQPRRRLVFIGFTGEERGLLGSRHYVAHPRYALETTAAMLNLDMVGRMSDRQLIVYGTGSAASFDRMVDVVGRRVGLNVRKQIEGMGPSDHQPFFERRVPVLHFFTGLHEDYHRPSDDFAKINTVGMVAITDMVYQLGSELAKSPQRPQYIAVKGRANIRIPIERKGRLGLRMGLNEFGNAIEINAVQADSVAAKAGIQSGDWILSLDGEVLKKPESVSQRLAEKREGETAKLSIQRGSERFEIEVVIPAP